MKSDDISSEIFIAVKRERECRSRPSSSRYVPAGNPSGAQVSFAAKEETVQKVREKRGVRPDDL